MTRGPRVDMHVHSRASPDSQLSVEDIFREALVKGLDGVALTDHNTVAGIPAFRQLIESTPGFLLIPGVEVSTSDGHVLVYGVEKALPPHRPARETIETARKMGGVPVLAHPFRWAHGVGRHLAQELPAQGIESMNGHNSDVPNARAGLVASKRGLADTGGSDAHEPGGVGRCFTEADEPATSAAQFLELVRKGRVRGEGESQTVGGRISISLRNGLKRVSRGGSGV